jgi:phage gp29-like protein
MAGRFMVAMREIASVERNIFHPYVGQLLLNEDGTLAQRGGMMGLRIYDDLERDGRVYSVMQKRKLALAAYPWLLEGGNAATKKLVSEKLKGMNFIETITGLMDAILKGFAVGEVMWEIDGDELVPRKVITRDQRRFRFDIYYVLHLLTYGNMLVGEDLPPRKFIVHSFGAKDGSPYGLGLGTRLFWCVFFKRQDIGFWLAYLDKFGMPTAMGKYPPDSSEALKDKLREALDAIAQDTGILVPEGMVIELLEAEGRSGNDGYEKLARYMDEQIAEIVLGETLTTNIGSVGSKAAAGVHNDVRLELVQADAELLAGSLNDSLVPWIVDLNMPGAPYPRIRWEVQQPEDLTARATRDTQIVGWGFMPTLKYVKETYGGEWVEKPTPAPLAPGDDPAAAAARFAEAARRGPSPTPAAFAERLGAEAQPSVETMAKTIRDLLGRCSSLEEARDRVIELYPDLDARHFAEVMTEAVAAADLAGRHEVR